MTSRQPATEEVKEVSKVNDPPANLIEECGDRLFKAMMGETPKREPTELDKIGQRLFDAIDNHGVRRHEPEGVA